MTAMLEATQPQTTAIGGASLPPGHPAHDKTGSFTFSDLLDVINPLQHIPVVGTIYRSITGDSISPAARIAGGTLYGGVFGFAGSIVDSLVEGETGKDIGSHIMATVFGDDDAASPPPVEAAESPQPAAVPASIPTATVAIPNISPAVPAPQTASIAAAQAGSTGYFNTLQRGGHSSRGVPLNASIPQPQHSSPPTGTAKAQAQAPAQSTPAAVTSPASPVSPLPGAPASVPLPGTTAPASVGPMSSNQGDAALVASVPGTALPAMMMKALDKYRTMETQRSAAIAQTNSAALMNN